MNRTKIWIGGAGLALFVLATWIWFKSPEPASKAIIISTSSTNDLAASESQTRSVATPVTASTQIAGTSTVPAIPDVSSARTRQSPVSTLFGENLRKLLNSDSLKNTDYVRMRLMALCPGSLAMGGTRADFLKQKMADEKAARVSDRIVIGSASYDRRLSSIARFDELCSKILSGTPLSDFEYAAHSSKPEMDRWRAIARAAKANEIDLENQQTKTALEAVVTTPLYGLLEAILYSKLDYTQLASSYPNLDAASLSNFVVPILLCRMGDDCGYDGFLTLQLCQNNGICGNDVESVIWLHLEKQHVNVSSLREFIDQRQRALTLLDFSILRSAKPKR
jgi:hypothetical protein